MSPCTPFLTEHLYQNLRRLKPSHPTDGSIHFQMMPDVDESLIKLDIERAVGNMTSVIQLGRTIRDRKVRAHPPSRYCKWTPLVDTSIYNVTKLPVTCAPRTVEKSHENAPSENSTKIHR